MKKIYKKGFALIELIIVLSIIAAITALSIPNYTKAETATNNTSIKYDMDNLRRTYQMEKMFIKITPGSFDETEEFITEENAKSFSIKNANTGDIYFKIGLSPYTSLSIQAIECDNTDTGIEATLKHTKTSYEEYYNSCE